LNANSCPYAKDYEDAVMQKRLEELPEVGRRRLTLGIRS